MYQDDNARFTEFMNSYRRVISSNYQEFENIRHNFLKKKILFLFLFLGAIVLSVSLNILGVVFKINGSAYSYIMAFELIAIITTFINYSFIDKKYRREMKKNLLQPLLKNVFNIETGSDIPVEYIKNFRYINNKKENSKDEIGKKPRDDSFQGEYSGIKFQVEEADIYTYNGDIQSKSVPFLFLFFKLNKLSNIKSEINTKKLYLYKNPETISQIAMFLVLAVIFILFYNWKFVIEDNLFLMTLTENFANWFFKWYLVLKVGTPVFLLLLLFLFNLPFICFAKLRLKKTEFETKGSRINPKFLNLLNELSYVYGALSVNCRLFNDSITIAVDTKKDLFEIGNLRTPINQSQSIQTFYKELNIIFKIVDYLVENNEDITI